MEPIYGRETQFKTLLAALGTNDKRDLPPCFFLWGQPSTGKTYVLNKTIEAGKITHTARLSATEIMCGRRPFFETLLRQLLQDVESECDLKCDNLRIFIRHLKHFIQNSKLKKERFVIIVDEAEQLRKEHPDIIDAFVNLQNFTQGNICVVLSSSLSPVNFCSIPNMRSIPFIHFPQYSKDDIIKIIINWYPPEVTLQIEDPQIYRFYVGMVVDVFYQNCRDFKKLLRLTKSNWPYFYRHYRNTPKQSQQPSLNSMWKNIKPRLQADFKSLNCNFVPMPEKNLKLQSQSVEERPNKIRKVATVPNVSKDYDDIPKYSKYLLIASYLATHNPPSSDKRFFVKLSTRNRAGKKSKLNLGGDTGDDSEKSRSLRSADLTRIKAIFEFIVRYCSSGTETYEFNVDFLVQISTLCQARFIQSLGEDSSGNFRFRCLADFDFITDISKSVKFEVEKYLVRLL